MGDSLYVRVVAEHLAKTQNVVACADYPDVFIGSGASVEPFTRAKINVLAHYSARKPRQDSNQWEDVCSTAGVGKLPLRFTWTVRNQALIDSLRDRAGSYPIIVVHGGRVPMGRTDGFGAELLPKREAFDAALSVFPDGYTVRVGGESLYPLHVNLDMSGKTSVSDLMDIFSVCDGVIAQCSFAVPMAECFAKPLLAIWSARGLASGVPFIAQITPKKILSAPTSFYAIDGWNVTAIQEAARTFMREPAAA